MEIGASLGGSQFFFLQLSLLSRELGFVSLSADDRTKDFRLFGRGGEGVAL